MFSSQRVRFPRFFTDVGKNQWQKRERELFDDSYHVIEGVVNSLDNLLVPFLLALFAVIHVIKIDRPDRRRKKENIELKPITFICMEEKNILKFKQKLQKHEY